MSALSILRPHDLRDHPLVGCPVCKFHYSHIREVFTRLGSDEHEATVYKGTVAKGQTADRRSALVVVFDGECGHSWEWVVQQHKGLNFVQTNMRPDSENPMNNDAS